MKILHLSDLHLGHRCYGITRRQMALRKNFTGIHAGGLNDVVHNVVKPDVIIIAGDLFDNSSPTYDDLDVLRNWIYNVEVPVIGITGNHDKLPDSFMQVSRFLGIEQPGTYGDLKIICANHMFRSTLKEYAKKVEVCDILMLHQSMYGFLSSIMRPEIDEETANILSEKCSYLALGDLHIHNRMRINNCIAAYPGTLDFLKLGESHNKFGGWLIEEKDGGIGSKSVEIKPYQKTRVLDVKNEEHYKKLQELIDVCDNDFLVIKAVEHPTLYSETLLKLNNKRHECENFCYRMDEVESNSSEDGETGSDSFFDEDFMAIIDKDKTIMDDDKKLASDVWNAPSPKAIQSVLAHDLAEEQTK